jgi:hypothetical protein
VSGDPSGGTRADSLIKMIDEIPYGVLFNAISDATELEWGGTAIGISVIKFRESVEKSLKDREARAAPEKIPAARDEN